MRRTDNRPLSRDKLLDYFLRSATPREEWQIGMELEKMGRVGDHGGALPYEGSVPSVRAVLDFLRDRRGADPVWEGEHLVGLDAPWGTISLEPGGQVEWSSRPYRTLLELERALQDHLDGMRAAEDALGVRWVMEAVDPQLPLQRMEWMPKARYRIMRPYLGERGRLAHRMMTQTASIQCAYDYEDPADWLRKFKAAALVAPVATALFANSSRVDGQDSGHRSYRQAIWRETDPDRCGLPAIVFDPTFDLEAWLDWVLDAPTIFLHRARGLVPAGGVVFRQLMQRTGCDAMRLEDWETHISTIFTEVRSYTYIEVRCNDLQPDDLALSVPALWTGLLYDEQALDGTLTLLEGLDGREAWTEAMKAAARRGLDGKTASGTIRELAARTLGLSLGGLERGASGTAGPESSRALARLAHHLNLEPRT